MEREKREEQLTQEENNRLKAIYKGLEYKKNKENYPNTTWDSLNEELGKPFANGESFRCAVKSFQRSLRGDGEHVSEDALPYASNDEQKILELKKEKVKLSSLRIDLNKRIREQARNELLYEEFIRALRESVKLELPQFKKIQNQEDDKEYLLAFSDIHLGKKFKSFSNEYSVNTVYENFNKLYNEVYDLVLEKRIKTLHVLSLGDLIEGMTLRTSQLSKLEIGLIDQEIQIRKLLFNWLNKLSEIVNIKYYTVKSSNHTQIRPFNSKPNEFKDEDMERSILSYLVDMFQDNPRVEIIEGNGLFNELKLFNYSIVLLHGHEIKGDYSDLLKDISWKTRKFYDYAFVGHRHCGGTIVSGEGATNNCEVIRVPSIMGSDEYADELLVGSKAGALFVEFTKKQGKREIIDIILN